MKAEEAFKTNKEESDHLKQFSELPPTEQKDIGVTQPEAKIANLWIAVMMNEMKPRSVIPIVKKAFIGGFQSRDKEITSLRAENERLKKQIEWLEKEYQNKAH